MSVFVNFLKQLAVATDELNAVHSLMNDARTDLHYSTVSSLSKKDAEKLKSEMVQLIERYVDVVKPSTEEVVYTFNLDFFGLVKN